MEHENKNGTSDKDILYLMGGLALMALGAGLVMTHPKVRKAVVDGAASVLPGLQGKLVPDISGVGEDIQRYMKLRAM